MKRRTHRVTVFGIPDMESKVRASGLDFIPVGRETYPLGSSDEIFLRLSRMSKLQAVKETILMLNTWAQVMLAEAPALMQEAGVEALIANQGCPESGTLADECGIPFITVSSALIFNYEIDIPPPFTTWTPAQNKWQRARNLSGYMLQGLLSRPIISTISSHRRKKGLKAYRSFNDAFSPLAQISQFPREFEFPRKELPKWFHFTGPFHSMKSRAPINFPWDKISSHKPLVYASLGSLQVNHDHLYQIILDACEGLDIQLVLSLGGGSIQIESLRRPSNALVVKYAPQIELLAKASLLITHGGTNSVMEALMLGVPVCALPITNDHPGCAARLKMTGAGDFLKWNEITPTNLRKKVLSLLHSPETATNAKGMQRAIQDAGGVSRAADIIEEAIRTSSPVYSSLHSKS